MSLLLLFQTLLGGGGATTPPIVAYTLAARDRSLSTIINGIRRRPRGARLQHGA